MMKLLLVIIFCCLPILESKFYHRFNKIQCGASLKSAVNYKCFIKAYVRRYPMLNIEFTLTRSVPNGMVWYVNLTIVQHHQKVFGFQVFFDCMLEKSSGLYVPVMQYPEIPLCAIVGGMNTNFILQKMLETAQSVGKGLLEVCSRKGLIKAGNISFINSTLSILMPAGNYKNTYRRDFEFSNYHKFSRKVFKFFFQVVRFVRW